MDRKYDLVVFGATGFTGLRVAEEIALRTNVQNPSQFKWAIAGRSAERLDAIVKQITTKNRTAALKTGNVNCDSIGVIVADVYDQKSMGAMAAQARVVLNCVGPYRFFGMPVAKACLLKNTHYVDVTGEPEFIERVMIECNAQAKQNGTLIVPTCGFDSIPSDLGVVHNQQQFQAQNGAAASIEAFIDVRGNGLPVKGHYATFESAVHGFANVSELRGLRKKRQEQEKPEKIEFLGPKQRLFSTSHFNKVVRKWCLPFPGADASVVRQTQQLLHELRKQDTSLPPPSQFSAYFTVKNRLQTIKFVFFFIMMALMVRFSVGRWLLLKFPKFFTFGVFSHEGPSEEHLKRTTFSTTFVGKGYSHTPVVDKQARPDLQIVTRLDGPEPGYILTPSCIVQAALCILEERDKIPYSGGVLTPAAAFRSTSLIDRLQAHGLKFSVVDKRNL